MKFYETIFILDAAPEAVEAEIRKVTDLIAANKGQVVSVDRWGMRKLAYEIKRRTQGYYTCIYFKGEEKIPAKLENHYKLNENCLRYLTVVSIHSPEEIAERAEKVSREAAVATAAPPAEGPAAKRAGVEEEPSPQAESAEETEPQEPLEEEESQEIEAENEEADDEPSPTDEEENDQEDEEELPEAEEDEERISS